MALSIVFGEQKYAPNKPPPHTTVAALCATACKSFKLNPHEYELQLNGKPVDPSLTLKFANFKHGTKLTVAKIVGKRISAPVKLALDLADGARLQTDTIPNTASLFDALTAFQTLRTTTAAATAAAPAATAAAADAKGGDAKAAAPAPAPGELTGWTGIPPPEKNKYFEVTINIPGFMQPVIEIMNKKYDTMEALRSTSLADAGILSGSAKLKLTHRYVAPTAAPDAQANAMASFQQKWKEANGGNSIPLNSSASSSAAAAAAAAPPAAAAAKSDEPSVVTDRKLKIWLASSDQIRPSDFEIADDTFYDITARDSKIYSKAIKTSAAVDMLKHSVDQSSKTSKDYTKTTIRVRMPNRLYLEGSFGARQTVGELKAFVAAVLAPNTQPQPNAAMSDANSTPAIPQFYLYINPPRVVLSDDSVTLTKAGLVPAAIVNFAYGATPTAPTAAAAVPGSDAKTSTPEERAAYVARKKEERAKTKAAAAAAAPATPTAAAGAGAADAKTEATVAAAPAYTAGGGVATSASTATPSAGAGGADDAARRAKQAAEGATPDERRAAFKGVIADSFLSRIIIMPAKPSNNSAARAVPSTVAAVATTQPQPASTPSTTAPTPTPMDIASSK